MRHRIGLILLLALCSGCVAPPLSCCRPNVFVLQGITGYWPGCCQFERALREAGTNPIMAWGEEYYPLAEFIADERDAGRLDGPLVIVGYSLGANTAILLAERLKERNVEIDKLVLLEVSYDDEIPCNVRDCCNIYKSNPWTDWFPIFRGLPLAAECDETAMTNFDVRDNDTPICRWDNHLTMCMNHHVHELIVEQVLEGLGAADDACDFERCRCPAGCR